MAVLENKEFLDKVTTLLSKNGGKSSVYITQKRFSYNIDDAIDGVKPFSDLPSGVKPILHEATSNEKTYPVLIRVTDGNKDKSKKVKLSTVVQPENLDSFWNEYTNILKTGFVGLKKKTKKKAKKAPKSASA